MKLNTFWAKRQPRQLTTSGLKVMTNPDSNTTMNVVGYLMTEKKHSKMKMDELAILCRKNQIELKRISWDQPLEDQGPYDVMLSKITDLFAEDLEGDTQAKHKLDSIKKYICCHPNLVVVDPLENVGRLCSRNEQNRLLNTALAQDFPDSRVFVPPFVELLSSEVNVIKKQLKEANVTFPFIIKPSNVHGPLSHQMSMVYNEDSLADVKPPCVAQSFVNHDERLYKLFAIGTDVNLVMRPSLKNVSNEDRMNSTMFFHTHNVSKGVPSQTDVHTLDPDSTCLYQIARCVIDRIGLTLFGADIVVESATGRLGIIDLNVFPGYDGVHELHPKLIDFLRKALAGKHQL